MKTGRKNRINKIASDNTTNIDTKIASDNTIKNSLISFENDFNGLEKVISLFFPSIRNEMILRYRAETISKVGILAYKKAKDEDIQINSIPVKIAIPIIEKMSLEHEPDMYKKWASLLIATCINPDPIKQQYADKLANINSKYAKFLKEIFKKQKDRNLEKKFNEYSEKIRLKLLNKEIDEQLGKYGQHHISNTLEKNITFTTPLEAFKYPIYKHGTEKSFEKINDYQVMDGQAKKVSNERTIFKFSKEDDNMLLQLEEIGLIKYYYLSSKWENEKNGENIEIKRCGVLLTRYGHSFINCLENPINSDTET